MPTTFPTPAKYRATVAWSRKLTSKVYAARITLPADSHFTFLAGQYCSFIYAPTVRRNLSMTTTPQDPLSLEFCADVTPMGPASQWLMSAKEGDSVEILGPLGRFVVEKQSPREKVFVATGTGIAPFRSMIKDVLESGWPGKIRLYWGLRYEEDVFWDEEFKSLQQAYPTFGYTLTLSRATDTWEESASRRRGRVTDHIIKEDNTSEKEYYLCGNRPMIDEIKSMLLAKGVPEVQMKTELFY